MTPYVAERTIVPATPEPTPFARALAAYGLERCSVVGPGIWIGLGPDADHGGTPLRALPTAPRVLSFVEAPLQADLLRALVRSPEAETLEALLVGTSHAFIDKLRAGTAPALDSADAIAALSEGLLPALKALQLGEMIRLYNGHRGFGALGDITPIFAAAPALEALDLCGTFDLTRPVRHARLRQISVEIDECGIQAGTLTQATVTNLLSSRFPALVTASVDRDEGDPSFTYEMPEALFTGDGFPAIVRFDLDCMTPATEARFDAWKAARGAR